MRRLKFCASPTCVPSPEAKHKLAWIVLLEVCSIHVEVSLGDECLRVSIDVGVPCDVPRWTIHRTSSTRWRCSESMHGPEVSDDDCLLRYVESPISVLFHCSMWNTSRKMRIAIQPCSRLLSSLPIGSGVFHLQVKMILSEHRGVCNDITEAHR